MFIHGTARTYKDIYAPNKDCVNLYPPMRDGSGGLGEANISEAESTNEKNLGCRKGKADGANDEWLRRVHDERVKAP